MVTCRQCGAVHRDDNVTACSSCGGTYFTNVDLWDQAYADLGRRMGAQALEDGFPWRRLTLGFLRVTIALFATVALLVFIASRMS